MVLFPSLPPAVLLMLAMLLGLATAADIRQRRIPNGLTIGGALTGIACWTALAGPAGLMYALLGLAVGLAVFLPFYLACGLGAGDVKLMAAVGALLGPGHVFIAALLVAIVGGLIAAAVALYFNRLGEALRNTAAILLRDAATPSLETATAAESIPYALAISTGVLGYVLFVGA